MNHDMLDLREGRFDIVMHALGDCVRFGQRQTAVHGDLHLHIGLVPELPGPQGVHPVHAGMAQRQAADGAYLLYNLPLSKEAYDALVPGTKIRVTGYKSEWSGEVEIIDISSFEVIEGDTFVAGPSPSTPSSGRTRCPTS